MTMEEQAVALLKERGLTAAAAESCTGGLVAKRLTDIPGASAVFSGGVVAYTNGVKERVLGVPHETLARYSAVSEETARAMAQGVMRLTGADMGLAVTGAAGPDRDDAGHEVGTVYIALAQEGEVTVQLLHLSGSRSEIRAAAADAMLSLALTHIR